MYKIIINYDKITATGALMGNHEEHGVSRRLVDRGGNAASPRKPSNAASPSIQAPPKCGSKPDGVRQLGYLTGLAEPIRHHAGSVLLRALSGYLDFWENIGSGYVAMGESVRNLWLIMYKFS
ncbi:MAG: hypothetical protein PF795_00490 [Kiritimatiellae bacterium]|nr:hypothetical protein [Kiritimatiellia bacterium]